MKRTSASALILVLAFAVDGCGGGGGDHKIVDPRTDQPVAFIDWGGRPGGETVMDFGQKEYKFTIPNQAAESCLFDVRSETVITSFCHAPGQASNRYFFVRRYIDVRIVELPDASCGAAMVDVELGSIVQVYVKNGGVTVVADPDPALTC